MAFDANGATVTVTGTGETQDAQQSATYLAAPAVRRGVTIDRYLVLDALGAGGMGVVYAAYDPELDRRVAIKLVREEAGPGATARRERLLREARAMAKLDHPNVVRVFDAGTVELAGVEQVFVAMELVAGEPLGTWAKARPWREVLRVLLAAGRGLVAAHAAGLVHRDFKPDNVLVDGTGSPHVGDFGLVANADEVIVAGSDERGAAGLTHTGTVMGTPAFMAPEQHRGVPVDARADQFAFCATAWLLVYREHPFDLADVRTAVLAGMVRPVPRGDAPGWLESLLRKGLAVDPAARHASLAGLLDELERRLQPRRRRNAVAAIVIAGALVAIPILAMTRGTDEPSCPTAESRLRGAWDPAGRAALVAKGDAGSAAAGALDVHARVWSGAHAETCTARRKRSEAPAALARRETCLELRRAQLAETAARLISGDPALLAEGAAIVHALPTARGCLQTGQVLLEYPVPDDPALAGQVTAARAVLELAGSLVANSQYAEAERSLDALDPRALAYAPFAAEVAAVRGDLHYERDDDKAPAIAAYDDAIRDAARSGHDAALVRALVDRAFVLQEADKPVPEVARWYALAEATIDRLGRPGFLLAALYTNRADLRRRQGDVAGALSDARAAYDLVRAEHGPSHPRTGRAASALGVTLHGAGREAEAVELVRDALAHADALLPPEHDVVRGLLDNLAAFQISTRDVAAARKTFERLMATEIRVLGPDHPKVTERQLELGALLGNAGDHAGSVAVLEPALASTLRRLGDDAVETAMLRHNLAISLDRSGRPVEAQAEMRRAVGTITRALGPDHPALVGGLTSLGFMLLQHGDLPGSEAELRKAIAIAERAFPADSPGIANPHSSLALTLSARGKHAEARKHALRAIALARGPKGKPPIHAEAEYALAHALDGLGDRPAARAAAERSIALYRAVGEGAEEELAKVEAWLAAHPQR